MQNRNPHNDTGTRTYDGDAIRAPRRAKQTQEEQIGTADNCTSTISGQTTTNQAEPNRELPVTGSAAQLRELTSIGEQDLKILDGLDIDALTADVVRKRRLLYAAMSLVGLGVVVFFLSRILQWTQIAYITKFSLIAAPFCLAFGISDLCMHVARSRPRLAQRLLGWMTFGNTHAIRRLVSLHIDTGDYTKAEQLLGKLAVVIDQHRRLRDYIVLRGFLATLRAHLGRQAEASEMMREILTAAEDHHRERNTNGSAFLLVETLTFAAQVSDQQDRIREALTLSRQAVTLLCQHRGQSVELTLTTLAEAGYLCNVVGAYPEALAYLTKALELARNTGLATDAQLANIFSNLGIANLGIGHVTIAKRHLTDGEAKAQTLLGVSQRPYVYQCLAIYQFAKGLGAESLSSYEKAIESCNLLKPRESVLLMRIVREYTVLLRELCKNKEADSNEVRSSQIKDALDNVNALPTSKKSKKEKPIVLTSTKKSRIPVFWILLAGFWAYSLWNSGLRIAKFSEWLFLITAVTIVAVKLCVKFGPRVTEETSQGTIVAVVSVIPGLRAIVPELSLLPKRIAITILAAAIGVLGFVKLTSPAPDIVPDSGLLGQEYLVLGDNLVRTESFIKAKKSYERAVQTDANGAGKLAQLKLVSCVPKKVQSESTIEKNIAALARLKAKDKDGAKRLWEECTKEAPDFEYPYIHLARLATPSTDFHDLLESAKKESSPSSKSESVNSSSSSKNSEKTAPVTISSQPSSQNTERAKEGEDPEGTNNKPSANRVDPEKYQQAEELLQKALAINPACGDALLAMYELKTAQKDSKAAREYIDAYVKHSGIGSVESGLVNSLLNASNDLEHKTQERLAKQKNKKTEQLTGQSSSTTATKTAPIAPTTP